MSMTDWINKIKDAAEAKAKEEEVHCPTSGRTYKDWDEFLKKAAPYSVGEEFGRAQNIIFPHLEDWIDVKAPNYAQKFHETHDRVAQLEKKIDFLIEQNKRLMERLDFMEKAEHDYEETENLER